MFAPQNVAQIAPFPPTNINWNSVLNLSENDLDLALNNFDFTINELMDKYVPFAFTFEDIIPLWN